MAWSWVATGTWLMHCAAGGGLVLLLAWALMRRTRQPARQQRLGEYGVLAALLLAVLSLTPAWLVMRVPLAGQGPAALPVPAEAAPAPAAPGAVSDSLPDPGPLPRGEAGGLPPDAGVSEGMAPGPGAEATAPAEPLPPRAVLRLSNPPCPLANVLQVLLAGLGIAYAGTALLLAAHHLLGYVALRRLLRTAAPAPPSVVRRAASFWRGRRLPRLLVSRRLRVPISCGVWRPTVVLPAALEGSAEALTWVLAHELTHLERHDAWTCLLLGAGQLVYFYLPWFWWLRRQVGLCQEFVADAAVAARSADVAEYAQFLLSLVRAPAAPAGTTGVAGRPSDLLQRFTVLLQDPPPVERHCPWRWCGAAAVALFVPAVLAAGIGLQAGAAPPGRAGNSRPKGPAAQEQPPPQPLPALPPRDGGRATEAPPASRASVPPPGSGHAGSGAPHRAANRPLDPSACLGAWRPFPGPALYDPFDLLSGQRLVVEAALSGSAAGRARRRPHDMLLALDGTPVPADTSPFQARRDALRSGAARARDRAAARAPAGDGGPLAAPGEENGGRGLGAEPAKRDLIPGRPPRNVKIPVPAGVAELADAPG